MEDPRWLRLLTIGLVLAVLAVGYFLFTGRFASNTSKTQVSQAVPSANPTITAKPTILGQNTQNASNPAPTATPLSAYNRIANRTQAQGGETQVLPRTGFPLGLAVMLCISVMISGWGLRKFPR